MCKATYPLKLPASIKAAAARLAKEGSMPKCGAVPERRDVRIHGMPATEEGDKLAG
jgi:uncharacterized Zn-binding protein involved in type VI secretion